MGFKTGYKAVWLAKGAKKMAKPRAAGAPGPSDIALDGNVGDTVTVNVTDSNSVILDVSASNPTITATSDNTSVLTVDAPVGLTYGEHAVMPSPLPAPNTVIGTANVTVVCTAGDGSFGPFSFTYVATVSTSPPGAPAQITITHGPITINS